MAAYEVLRDIVRSGCDLTLYEPVAYSVLEELAVLAQQSGAKLTVTTGIAYETIRGLCKYRGTVAFIDGLDKFKKD